MKKRMCMLESAANLKASRDAKRQQGAIANATIPVPAADNPAPNPAPQNQNPNPNSSGTPDNPIVVEAVEEKIEEKKGLGFLGTLAVAR